MVAINCFNMSKIKEFGASCRLTGSDMREKEQALQERVYARFIRCDSAQIPFGATAGTGCLKELILEPVVFEDAVKQLVPAVAVRISFLFRPRI